MEYLVPGHFYWARRVVWQVLSAPAIKLWLFPIIDQKERWGEKKRRQDSCILGWKEGLGSG